MAGIAESVASDVTKDAVCYLVGEARYCYDFHSYIEDFRQEKYKLVSTIISVQDRERRANENTEKSDGYVSQQLVKAHALVQKAEKLEKKVETKSYCLRRYPNLICRYFLSRQAEKKALLMREQNRNLEVNRQFGHLQSLRRRHTSENIFNSNSTKSAYQQLWEALKDEKINKIGLYGMPGCGKTTLLKKLAEAVQDSNLFQKVASAVVSNHPNIRNIQGSIASWLNLKFDPEEGEPERATRLRMRLSSEEKILIILDDVWQKLEYEGIGIPSGSNQKNCTVLIATRYKQVCTLMDCQEVNLKLLDDDEAWNLFKKHAGIVNEDPHSSKSAQAREISKKCKGLPIAIVAVATSLKGKTPGDWKKALQKFRDREPVDIESGVINPYNCLQSSYDNLKDDNEAKDLFLLCSLFPEDSEIQVEDLIRSGTGLGIFGKSDSYEMVRSIVDSAINKLICSSMLLQGNERQSVMMHDLVRSMALSVAKKDIQVIMGSGKDVKAFAEVENTKDILRYLYCHNVDEFPNHLDFPKLEILILFKDGKCSSKVSGTFFKGMTGLKALIIIDRSLEETSIILLAPSVKFLTNVRTLCLKGCRFDKMDFLENLEKLETLEFYECRIAKLSYQIAELRKLKLLDVSHCRIGGNPYEVLGSCCHLQELYFLDNILSEIVPSDHNLAEFFDKEKGTSPNLQRYHLQIGSYIGNLKGNGEPRSKVLSISPFLASDSNATIKDLVQKTEILFLENIHGGCKNIIPDIIPSGGMNDLMELLLSESDEIECVIDASENLSESDTVFSNLNKLRIQNIKNLGALCRCKPSSGFFNRLEVLEISKCSQMKSILFEGELKLPSLKVLELNECQSLTSLFAPVVAQSLLLLQVLKIVNCKELKHIIAYEGSEIVSEDRSSVFPELKEVSVIECRQLEYLIPVSLAMGLVKLEILSIHQANMMKYVFGTSESTSSSQNHIKPKKMELPVLKQLELVNLKNIIGICSENHHPSLPSFCQPHLEDCPQLTSSKADAPVVGSKSEVRQHGDHSPTKQVKVDIGCRSCTIRSACNYFRINSLTEDLMEQRQKLILTAEGIKHSVEVAKRYGEVIDDYVSDWLMKAYELMDVVDPLIQEATRRRSVLNFSWRYRLSEHMERTIEELVALNIESRFDRVSHPRTVIMSEGFIHFISRSMVFDELHSALRDDQISMIGLYGMGGCGKTTLVKQVAKKAEQALIFDKVVFVVVSTCNVRKIQGQIASSLNMELKEEDVSERAKRLFLSLTSGQRILIILDDVWEKVDLEDIGIPFGKLHNGCCVLLTTRNLSIVRSMNFQKAVPLSLLSMEESWLMFQQYARITADSSATSINLAQEIARQCKGLPIAIATLASTLRGKSLVDWKIALRRLNSSKSSYVEGGPGDLCLVSYDHLLGQKAKLLFLLCSLFPDLHEIPMEILTRCAIGLGWFGKINNYEETRNLVRVAANELIDSCLLLEVHGKGCVTMHDLIRDAALWIAKGQVRVLMESERKGIQEKLTGEVRYLRCDEVNELPDLSQCGKLEFLYVCTNMVSDEYLLATEELRVLVLHNQHAGNISSLPLSKSVEWLKNLRCLVLYGWKLDNLSFIGSFQGLEALTFQHCSFDELPGGILQLTTLRLLDLSDCKIEREPYQLFGRCSQLEELYFTRCHNSNWKLQNDESAELFGKNSNLSLKRYRIEFGETFGSFGRVNYSVSRGLSLQYFDASTSNTTINVLIQKAEVLFLKEIKGGCKNFIPEIVQMEGMDELIEILLCNSAEMECLIDTTSSHATVFSKLLKLTIESMERVEFLCCGQPPLYLLAKLEELHMKRCYQMRGLLSAGMLTLSRLKVLELHECPMMISVFTTAVAQTLELLEVLKITQCNGLKCIVADEEEENMEIIEEQYCYLVFRNYLEFRKLKYIEIWDCQKLEYLFAQYNHEYQSSNQDGNQWRKEAIVIDFPVLCELNLGQLPMMVGFVTENYIMNWPELHGFYVSNCPNMVMGTINNCIVGTGLREHCFSTPKVDAMCIEKLGSLIVKDTEVEGIFHLNVLPTNEERVTSGLRFIDLYLLPELRYICMGPKHFLSLQYLEELRIERCGKLKFVFSTSIMRSLSNLKILRIVDCQELVQITEEDVENQEQLSNHGFQYACFPKLIILFVRNCNKLKRLFSVSTSHEFFKLKNLIIMGASELEEVFGWEKGEEYEDAELVLPNLELLILIDLPRLANVSQGIQLGDVDYWIVHDCLELGLASNITLKLLYQKFQSEAKEIADYGYELHWKLLKILESILYNEDSISKIPSHHQIDSNDQDSVQSSTESGYNENDSEIAPIASPNLTEQMKETIGNVPAIEIPGVETSSTDSELTRPSPSPLAVPLHEALSPELVENGLHKSISMEALEEIHETPQILDKPTNLPQKTSLQEMVGRASSNRTIITNEQAPRERDLELVDEESMGAQMTVEQAAIDENKINHEFPPIFHKPSDSGLVQNVEAHANPSTSETKSNKSAMAMSLTISESNDSEITLNVTPPQKTSPLNTKGSVDKGLNEPISLQALEKNKSTNETSQRLDENSNLALKTSPQSKTETAEQNLQEPLQKESAQSVQGSVQQSPMSEKVSMVTSASHDSESGSSTLKQQFEKCPEDPMRVSRPKSYLDKDSNASSLNLQDLMDDVFSVLNSIEKDDEVQEPRPSASLIPSDNFDLEDHQLLAKAFAELEAYLKMPLKDIANSETNIHCLANALKFLSSWSCGNGSPLEGLKTKIESLLQNMPNILASFAQASTTIDKFTLLDKRQKSIREELPRQKEAASTLEKSITEAQEKEVALKEKFHRLQVELKSTENEIKEHEVHLSSLKEQGKKLNADTIDFLKKFETVKKDKSEMVEDPWKAQQERFKASYEWLDLCNQLMQSCNAARNLF